MQKIIRSLKRKQLQNLDSPCFHILLLILVNHEKFHEKFLSSISHVEADIVWGRIFQVTFVSFSTAMTMLEMGFYQPGSFCSIIDSKLT